MEIKKPIHPKIITFPTPSLLKKSKEVADPTSKKIKKLLADLEEAMFADDGIGIAAPQIGVNLRVFLVNTQDGIIPFINPKITKRSFRKEDNEEGCLSVPGVYGMVRRSKKVIITAITPEGERARYEADGMFARVIQHEYDHIEGILFIERAKEITQGKEALKKMQEQQKTTSK